MFVLYVGLYVCKIEFLIEKFWTKTWGILEDLLDEQKLTGNIKAMNNVSNGGQLDPKKALLS